MSTNVRLNRDYRVIDMNPTQIIHCRKVKSLGYVFVEGSMGVTSSTMT